MTPTNSMIQLLLDYVGPGHAASTLIMSQIELGSSSGPGERV